MVNQQPYTCIPSHAHTYKHTCILIELSPFIVSKVVAVISFSLLFYCDPRIPILIHQRYLQFCRVLFLIHLLTHRVCQWLLMHVKPYASSSTFLFFGLFVWVPLLSILRIVPSILQEGLPRYLSFDKISAAELVFLKLSRLSNALFCLFSFFFIICLFFLGGCFFFFFFFFFISTCLVACASNIP